MRLFLSQSRLQHATRCRDSHGTVFTTSSPQIKLNVHWDRSSMFLSFMTPHVRFLHHHHRLARSFLLERPYKVGDSQGWKVYDSDFYNKWSEEKQFRIGDILLFEYAANEEGNDVSEINGDVEFMTCDPTSPVAVYKTGHDLVRLTELGNYYFITPRPFLSPFQVHSHQEYQEGVSKEVLVVHGKKISTKIINFSL
ncbi:hypothetical protein Bca4012_045016 [Brassica carinata]